jgi:predicted RNA-binding Zn-ribbon protein involved in translation (DUF1610 family)
MKELIHVLDNRSQLHCDEPACAHVLPEGHVTWGEHLIGYPCPRCGSNMLTREDYEASERLHRCVRWINKWFGWLGTEYKDDSGAFTTVAFRHHAGKIIVEKEEP